MNEIATEKMRVVHGYTIDSPTTTAGAACRTRRTTTSQRYSVSTGGKLFTASMIMGEISGVTGGW